MLEQNRLNLTWQKVPINYLGQRRTALLHSVTQFDANGEPMGVYLSIRGRQKNGFGGRHIAEAVNGNTHMYKGFFWKSGRHSKPLNLKAIKRKVERDDIHRSLMKRLGMKRLGKKIPPYLNLSTQSMEGERWKDVPGYEGLYMISNKGRVNLAESFFRQATKMDARANPTHPGRFQNRWQGARGTPQYLRMHGRGRTKKAGVHSPSCLLSACRKVWSF